MAAKPMFSIDRVDRSVLVVRGEQVILDADLAELYGVPTKRLNEQLKWDRNRFPEDFVFRFTAEEKVEVVANGDHLARLMVSPVLPYVFTKHRTIEAIRSAWLVDDGCAYVTIGLR